MHLTSLGPLADHARLVDIGLDERLCELDFEFPMCRGRGAGRRGGARCPRWPACCVATSPPTTRCGRTPTGWRAPGSGQQLLRGYLSGSIDVVLRVGCRAALPGRRLQDQQARHARRAADRARLHPGRDDRGDAALPLPAAGAALLRRAAPLPALAPARTTTPSGTSAGSSTSTSAGCAARRRPMVDGKPCGVFSWRPPAAMVVELSDLLAGHRPASGGGVVSDTRPTRPAATGGSRSVRPACCALQRGRGAHAADVHVAARLGVDPRASRASRCSSPRRSPSAPSATARSAST